MGNFIKKNHNILISLLTNIGFVAFAILFFGTRYATDDDISMARLAYGTFCEPQSRLVFSCTAFGGLLKILSKLVDGINWQMVLYYLFLGYGGVVSQYYVLKRNKKTYLVLWLLVVLAFYYSAYVNINFSIVTSMLAYFGYVTLFIGAYTEEKKPVILSAIILTFAMIVRYESFFAFSLFAVFAFFLILVKDIKKEGARLACFRYIVPFSVALFIPVCLVVADRLSYSEKVWSDYLEYNDNRSQILDFQSVLKYEGEDYFRKLGLSEEMVASLESWQFNDSDIFSEQLIVKMGNDSKEFNPKITLDFLFESLGYSVEKICKLYYFALGVVVLALATLKRSKDNSGIIHVFSPPWIMLAPLIAEISFYYFMNRGIDRVLRTTGLGFWCGIVVLFCCDYFENYDNDFANKRWLTNVLIAFLFLSICFQFSELSEIRGFHLVEKEDIDRKFSFLGDGRIYMCDIGSVRVIQDSYGVWQMPSRGSLSNCIELGGWTVNYPNIKSRQEELGVLNPYRSLAYNDNAYLLTIEDGKLQLEFLRSAYDKNIESVLIEKQGELFLYKYSVK